MSDEVAHWRVLWEQGRLAWPSVFVSMEDYVAHVQACGHTAASVPPQVASDLYIAAGCLLKDQAALSAFEGSLLPMVDIIASQLRKRGVDPDEARQVVRVRLFAGDSPKIAEYRGKGTLRGWLRVVATRSLLNLTASQKERTQDDLSQLALLTSGSDPELEYIKRAFASVFREALAEASQSLDTRERALLRLALIEGLGLEVLGTMFGVHQSTAGRWIQQAHRKLSSRLRASLRKRMHLQDAELDSVLRVASLDLDTTLGRYFASQTHRVEE
jgi:RNA polymerase sigma-70 factor (ECF subfamily)